VEAALLANMQLRPVRSLVQAAYRANTLLIPVRLLAEAVQQATVLRRGRPSVLSQFELQSRALPATQLQLQLQVAPSALAACTRPLEMALAPTAPLVVTRATLPVHARPVLREVIPQLEQHLAQTAQPASTQQLPLSRTAQIAQLEALTPKQMLLAQPRAVLTPSGIKTVTATLRIMLQAAITMAVTAAIVHAVSGTHHQIILVERTGIL